MAGPSRGVVIVGAGHAGAQAAIALRQRGYSGPVTLIGDEPDLPYERPPLSKDYLSGERPVERLLIRPPAFWAERAIALHMGVAVTAVDPAARHVVCANGAVIGYDALIWATGGRARSLPVPGADLAGLHAIRTRGDVDHLCADLAALPDDAPIVVVGGGFVGLESAAVLVKTGRPVTVVEAQSRLLARVAPPALSAFYEQAHRAHGVKVETGAQIVRLTGAEGRVDGVVLADGRLLPAGLVIAGIGIQPAVGPLIAAGAAGTNGIDVDDQGRTSLPDIWAVGDCAAHHNPFADGARIRLESVQNATDQANLVARVLMGESPVYDAVPWFWSNQYDLKLQTVGLGQGADGEIVRATAGTQGPFTVIALRGGRVIALDCVNATRDYVQGRALVQARLDARDAAVAARLADPAVPLKSLLT